MLFYYVLYATFEKCKKENLRKFFNLREACSRCYLAKKLNGNARLQLKDQN